MRKSLVEILRYALKEANSLQDQLEFGEECKISDLGANWPIECGLRLEDALYKKY
jgi:hypothetical protein